MKDKAWPSPLANEVFEAISNSKILTTIAFFVGYLQIKTHKGCAEEITFINRFGNFQFEVMLFGLMHSEVAFPRKGYNILANVRYIKYKVDYVILQLATD